MKKVKEIVETLPEKKRYAELITAVLSVPVLISVLLLNIMSLRKTNPPTSDKVAAISAQQVTPAAQSSRPNNNNPNPTSSISATPSPLTTGSPTPRECTKEIGPIEISSPSEGEVITKDPVCIDITRSGVNYCGVVWSYRINGGSWSEYMDKAICLYNLPPGSKTVDIKVKSLAGTAEVLLKRTFTIPTQPTTTPTASPSAQPVD